MKIENDVESFLEMKKSRFITYLHRTDSEEDAREFLRLVKKAHPEATHHCYALRIGSLERSNDDGEPAGTAGKPILGVLASQGIEDILAVVVRYFGGTLLGTGGLVRAYGSSVSKALEQTRLVESRPVGFYHLKADYEQIGKVEQALRQLEAEIKSVDYNEQVFYQFYSQSDPGRLLASLSSGQLSADLIRMEERDVALSNKTEH